MVEVRKIKAGIVQMRCGDNTTENMVRTMAAIRRAAANGANMVCLQELFRSRYFCVSEDYTPFAMAEAIPGPATEALQSLAGELGVVIVASLFEKRTEGLYHNSAIVIDADGTYLGKYRKMHIPDDPSFYEKFYFTPGDLGFRAFKTRFGTVGVLVCWDQWYPEAARLTALMGAEILFYPTAIGWAEGEDPQVCRDQFNAWQTIQRAHAIANGIPVVSVNRVGKEGNILFWGGSFSADTLGEMIYQAPQDKEDVAVFEIDLGRSDTTRRHWPFLRDRRIDAYDGLTRRFLDSDL
ncbi:MAG TPA: carbon-nitrogen hydrolase [Syntrophales bacterium]|nr:carbon-nitrogen hydrolase [Syntrophales bacterium]